MAWSIGHQHIFDTRKQSRPIHKKPRVFWPPFDTLCFQRQGSYAIRVTRCLSKLSQNGGHRWPGSNLASWHLKTPWWLRPMVAQMIVCNLFLCVYHYSDVIMSAKASQITAVSIVCSTVGSSVGQRKHQSSASLAFVWGIHRWPVNSPHKGSVTRKMFPFDDVTMYRNYPRGLCATNCPVMPNGVGEFPMIGNVSSPARRQAIIELMLTFCQLVPLRPTSTKFGAKDIIIFWTKCIWKYCQQHLPYECRS